MLDAPVPLGSSLIQAQEDSLQFASTRVVASKGPVATECHQTRGKSQAASDGRAPEQRCEVKHHFAVENTY